MSIPITEIVPKWVKDRIERLKLDRTDSEKCGRIVLAAAEMMGWETTDDITPKSCVAWLNRRSTEDNVSAGTMRNQMGALRSLGHYLVQIEHWTENPLESVQTPKVRSKERGPGARAFSVAEVRKLIAVADHLERTDHRTAKFGKLRSTFYRFLFETGLRYGEATSLLAGDVDVGNRLVRVRDDKAGRGESVPIGPELMRVLCRWIDDQELDGDDRLFRSVSHRTLTADMKRAGIPRRVDGQGGQWHCFRKGIVTHYLQNGVDIKAVQKLARHATVQTTLNFYYQLKDHEARAAVDGGVV